MLAIYGVYRSRASRPLWLLEEIGTPFTHVPVIQSYRVKAGEEATAGITTASPEFLAVNPQGQIPAMCDGDLVLTESLAITLHIARTRGGALGPQDAAELALMEQWALAAATGIETPALEIQMALGSGRVDTPEVEAALALCAERLRRPLARLEGHLAGRAWMVGDRFTVADVNMAEIVRYAQGHPTLLAGYPKVTAWLETCQSRPAFRAMWDRRLMEPA
ncbi:MAG: glutathione S-transferase family protein [Rhodobacteraceae bacterium]|nr:glutathione S-transferase family protein [Paracoccaceae bacterium]